MLRTQPTGADDVEFRIAAHLGMEFSQDGLREHPLIITEIKHRVESRQCPELGVRN
jgi:hypothetical protein